jgi:hypothetical protein
MYQNYNISICLWFRCSVLWIWIQWGPWIWIRIHNPDSQSGSRSAIQIRIQEGKSDPHKSIAIFDQKKIFKQIFCCIFFFSFWSSKPGSGYGLFPDTDSLEMLDPDSVYQDPQLCSANEGYRTGTYLGEIFISPWKGLSGQVRSTIVPMFYIVFLFFFEWFFEIQTKTPLILNFMCAIWPLFRQSDLQNAGTIHFISR